MTDRDYELRSRGPATLDHNALDILGAEKCWATYISQSKKCHSKQAVRFVKHNL